MNSTELYQSSVFQTQCLVLYYRERIRAKNVIAAQLLPVSNFLKVLFSLTFQ